MKTLEILIKPSIDSTRNSMGISENEDYNSDAVLFQQGYDMDIMQVEPDDSFKISGDYEGEINCSETHYKFIKLKNEWDDEPDEWGDDYHEPDDPITLTTGYYKFLEDGITIKQIANTEY